MAVCVLSICGERSNGCFVDLRRFILSAICVQVLFPLKSTTSQTLRNLFHWHDECDQPNWGTNNHASWWAESGEYCRQPVVKKQYSRPSWLGACFGAISPAAMQRYLTATSARFRVSQFHDLRCRPTDVRWRLKVPKAEVAVLGPDDSIAETTVLDGVEMRWLRAAANCQPLDVRLPIVCERSIRYWHCLPRCRCGLVLFADTLGSQYKICHLPPPCVLGTNILDAYP